MARLTVGGVDCEVDGAELTLGHVVIPLRDLLAYGIADSSRELVFAYERRAPVEVGYRGQRSKGNRATVVLTLSGDAEVLMSLLHEYAPHAWRGYCRTTEEVLEGPTRDDERAHPVEPPRPIRWGRWVALGAGVVIGVVLALVVGVWLT